MKKFLLVLLATLVCSCGGKTSERAYDPSFSADLQSLLNETPEEYSDKAIFSARGSIAPSSEHEGFSIVTLEISYKDTEIASVGIISLPLSMDLTSEIASVANIGYQGETFTLSANTDASELRFRGFRLSYLTPSKDDGLKFSVRGNGALCRYRISKENLTDLRETESYQTQNSLEYSSILFVQ